MSNIRELETALMLLMSSSMKTQSAMSDMFDLLDAPPLLDEARQHAVRDGREKLKDAAKNTHQLLKILLPEVLEEAKGLKIREEENE